MKDASINNTFAVLLDGDVTVTPRLLAQLSNRKVVAADGGIRHAEALDAHIDVWVGDFDSTPSVLMDRFAHVKREAFPAAKDRSDGELAISHALAMGATNVMVMGASGGPRTDHIMFNLMGLAARQLTSDANIWATSGREEFYPLGVGTPFEIDLPDGTVFSIVGLAMEGLTISGARWPLDNVGVETGSALTLSNSVQGGLRITLSSGIGLVVVQL